MPDIQTFAQNQNRWLVPYKSGLANPVWTRHCPKRVEELLAGGSMYRVIKNRIQFRHKILGFEEVIHEEKGKMCVIMTSPEIIRTISVPKRAFQGWRYLNPEDAPADIGVYDMNDEDTDNDSAMGETLAALGLI